MGHEPAPVDDGDAVASDGDFGKYVGRQDDGVIAAEGLDELPRVADLLRIEPRRGLVEDEHFGLVDEGLGDPDSLPIAFRQIPRRLVADFLQLTPLDHRVDPRSQHFPSHAFDLGREAQIGEHAHFGVERWILRQVADLRFGFERRFENVVAGDADRAGRGRKESGQHAHGRCLACAVGTEKTEDLAPAH